MTANTHDTINGWEHSSFKRRWTELEPSACVMTRARLSIAAQTTVASAIGASVTGLGITNECLPFVSVSGEGPFIGLAEQLICSDFLNLNSALEVRLFAEDSPSKAAIIYFHGLVLAAGLQAIHMASITGWPSSISHLLSIHSEELFWPCSYLSYMEGEIRAERFDFAAFSDCVEHDSFNILTRNWHLVSGCFNRLRVGLGEFQPFPLPDSFQGFWEGQMNTHEITSEMCANAWRAGLGTSEDGESVRFFEENRAEDFLGSLFKGEEV